MCNNSDKRNKVGWFLIYFFLIYNGMLSVKISILKFKLILEPRYTILSSILLHLHRKFTTNKPFLKFFLDIEIVEKPTLCVSRPPLINKCTHCTIGWFRNLLFYVGFGVVLWYMKKNQMTHLDWPGQSQNKQIIACI